MGGKVNVLVNEKADETFQFYPVTVSKLSML